VAIHDIQGITEIPQVHGKVADLKKLGLVEVESVRDQNDRKFTVVVPEYTGEIVPFEDLLEDTQLAYEFFGDLGPGGEFAKQEVHDVRPRMAAVHDVRPRMAAGPLDRSPHT
jgi:hypothetical protein